MQRDLKFALFGNTYQEHKSAHVTHLLEILRKKNAHISISNEFYDFLRQHTRADLGGVEIFQGNNFNADMVLSIGGDGTFLRDSDTRYQYRKIRIPCRYIARPDGGGFR